MRLLISSSTVSVYLERNFSYCERPKKKKDEVLSLVFKVVSGL